MTDKELKLSPNSIAFIALANEYCQTLERAGDFAAPQLVNMVLKLLARIYVCALDIQPNASMVGSELMKELNEEQYDAVRAQLAAVIGENDTYLEVFEEDMQYSDTPIAVTISENLADLYQEMFDLVASVKDMPTLTQQETIEQCRQNFHNYWGQTVCNVLRALNSINSQFAWEI